MSRSSLRRRPYLLPALISLGQLVPFPRKKKVSPLCSGSSQGYLPANKERRELVLRRKREEYFGFIEQYYHSRTDEHYKDTYRQVRFSSMHRLIVALNELDTLGSSTFT